MTESEKINMKIEQIVMRYRERELERQLLSQEREDDSAECDVMSVSEERGTLCALDERQMMINSCAGDRNEITENRRSLEKIYMEISKNILEAMQYRADIEKLAIRVRRLETEVGELKNGIS